jgi:hypothetical protein
MTRQHDRQTWKVVLIALGLAAVAFGLFALLVQAAEAQEHRHPPADALLHGQFYNGWMRPDNRASSCCNLQDCAPTKATYDAARRKWRALSPVTKDWIDIPDHTIEREREVPPGAHLCINKTGVICFGVGGGT